jgi:hypothetical protein
VKGFPPQLSGRLAGVFQDAAPAHSRFPPTGKAFPEGRRGRDLEGCDPIGALVQPRSALWTSSVSSEQFPQGWSAVVEEPRKQRKPPTRRRRLTGRGSRPFACLEGRLPCPLAESALGAMPAPADQTTPGRARFPMRLSNLQPPGTLLPGRVAAHQTWEATRLAAPLQEEGMPKRR